VKIHKTESFVWHSHWVSWVFDTRCLN